MSALAGPRSTATSCPPSVAVGSTRWHLTTWPRWAQRATTLAYRIDRDAAAYPDPERARPTTPYRARTINFALTTLHRVYAHPIRRQGYAGISPVAALERAERPTDEPERKIILTPEQLAAVLDHAAPTYRPVLAFLAATGCRLGEALGLTWADLDLAERTARIEMQLDRRGRRVPVKTANGRRTLDLPGSLVTALAAHKLAAPDTAPAALVFTVNWRSVQRALAAACK